MSVTEKNPLPDDAFTRADAEVAVAQYRNVTVEDDQGTHFRLVVRDDSGMLVWRAWNFEPEAGYWLNGYIHRYGALRT